MKPKLFSTTDMVGCVVPDEHFARGVRPVILEKAFKQGDRQCS